MERIIDRDLCNLWMIHHEVHRALYGPDEALAFFLEWYKTCNTTTRQTHSDQCLTLKEIKEWETLELRSKNIQVLPVESMHMFFRLTKLDLRNNQITGSLPKQIQHLINLEEMFVSFNHIEIVPPEIQFLQKLKILDLSSNWMKELPDELQMLKMLEFLDVSYNSIKCIANAVKGLGKLSHLSVSSNMIEEIKDLQSLTSLQALNISRNDVSSLDFLKECKSLTSVDASYNPIDDVPFDLRFSSFFLVVDGYTTV